MTFLLLVAAAAAWWMWGRKLSYPQLAAAASALAGIWLITRGSWQVAIPMLMPGLWMLTQQGQKAPPTASQMELDEARRILGVDARAGADEIREAHRRLVAKVHPDQGGSAELATRVNAARDMLLAELGKR